MKPNLERKAARERHQKDRRTFLGRDENDQFAEVESRIATLEKTIAENLTALEGARTRLSILKGVASAAQAILRSTERNHYSEVVEQYLGPEIRGLRLALLRLDELEASQCPSP